MGILPLLTRQYACQWEKKVGGTRKYPPVEFEHPEEAAELLECFGHRKAFNLMDVRWGRADALIINDVAQEFYLRCAEDTRFLLTANRASIERTRTTQDIIRERYCFTNCNI